MNLKRTGPLLKPDPNRVVLRPFQLEDTARRSKVLKRVLELSEAAVEQELEQVRAGFGQRHRELEKFWLWRSEEVWAGTPAGTKLGQARRTLIGAYFTMEYALEGAALFNPSLVWHPDQAGLAPGQRRFIMSLRATGEGHISSLTFRSGQVDAKGTISLDPPSQLATLPEYRLAGEGYEASFKPQLPLAERTLFPITPAEKKGIEDARFVRFEEAASPPVYYATYTAYDGQLIHSHLLETGDFLQFKVKPLKGPAVQNKGMALFPRKINGLYAMISRQDNENIYLMTSERVDTWEAKQILVEPAYPWEFIQLGNCGPPLETEAGWLLLSHGVGPMRRYTLGAFLLDRDDPGRVVGRLREPLLAPEPEEREGYVPNVVYSCGGLIHQGRLILPYAMSDQACSFAVVVLEELLAALRA